MVGSDGTGRVGTRVALLGPFPIKNNQKCVIKVPKLSMMLRRVVLVLALVLGVQGKGGHGGHGGGHHGGRHPVYHPVLATRPILPS